MKVIVWDFDATLAQCEGMWTGTLCEILAERAPEFAGRRDVIRECLRTGFPWHRPEIAHSHLSRAEDWWEALFPVFTSAFRTVGLSVTAAESAARDVRARYSHPERWSVLPDALPTLKKLNKKGWTQIILSNHVPELPVLVEQLELSCHFYRVVCSAATGFEKPHPGAYAAAIAGLGELETIWMIGDSHEADVVGPRRCGWNAILVRRPHPDAEMFSPDLSGVVDFIEGTRRAE